MNAHRPEFHLSTAADGRLTARCLVCMDASQPTLHRPNAEAWMRAHIKESSR
jgi:hypothetical protein